MEFQELVLTKLDKIEEKQGEHTAQLAVNTQILSEHHRRSTNLEDRLLPIEDHVKFIQKALKVSTYAVAALGTIGSLIALLFK